MKVYNANMIRNIALVGHGGEGKTTLTEAMLNTAGHTDRMGKVEDGSTITDYDVEETKRKISIGAAIAPVEWNDHKLNFIDVPGYFDFEGEMIQALNVVDSALIVLGAVSGLSVGAEKATKYCNKRGVPHGFIVNRMDVENANFFRVTKQLKDDYSLGIAPVQIPILTDDKYVGYVEVISRKARFFDGKNLKSAEVPDDLIDITEHLRAQLVEKAAENDDDLLEKFFTGEELTDEEVICGLRLGIAAKTMFPIFCVAAAPQLSIGSLLNNIITLMPSPLQSKPSVGINLKTQKEETRPLDEKAPFSCQIFKTVTDAFVGKISLFKILSGSISGDTTVLNATTEKTEKSGQVYYMRGKKTYPIEKLCAGDIGAFAKLNATYTGDTLCDPAHPIKYNSFKFPKTAFSMAITAKKSGEEDKVFGGLNKLLEEDLTFKLNKNSETGDMIISGLGEMHLDIICSKIKNKFNVEAKLEEPKIAYRETIKKTSKANGRHKKQSGGHGQFGDVWVEFEPIVDSTQEFEFVDKVVGGVVPRNYIPAVEKGLREAMVRGVLAGFPTINVKATLYDGSYHSVDSNEMAFRTAARLAYKKGIAAATPTLMEPIYKFEVYVPDDYMGDIIGDLNRRRGRILGMTPTDDGDQQIIAEVPFGEMFKYATDLRSMTQGRGVFESTFERYEEVPPNLSSKIIEKAKKELDEDED